MKENEIIEGAPAQGAVAEQPIQGGAVAAQEPNLAAPEEAMPQDAGASEQGNPDAELIAKHFPTIPVSEETMPDLLAAANKIERFEKVNTELAEIAAGDPTFGLVLMDLRKGSDFVSAIARHVDLDELTPMEGDPDYDSWSDNVNKRKETKAQKEARMKEQEENIASSVEALTVFKDEKGLADEDAEGFMGYMMEMLDAAFSGKLTPEFINRMYMAMNYDADTDANYQKGVMEGEVKGKNAKIEDLKANKSKTQEPLPDLSEGGMGEAGVEKKEPLFKARSTFRV